MSCKRVVFVAALAWLAGAAVSRADVIDFMKQNLPEQPAGK